MISCGRRGCRTPELKVERWSPGLYLCGTHRQMLLDQAREHERRMAARHQQTNREVLLVAMQAAGPSRPPRYKLTHRGQVRETSGGLPSLGKDQ